MGGAAALAGLAGWQWLVTRSEEDGLPWPLRRVLGLNERLARAAFRASRLPPQFPRSAARSLASTARSGLTRHRPGRLEASGHRPVG